jgi:hypothetical protein
MTKIKKSMSENIVDIMRRGTSKWTKTRKAEERSPSSRSSRTVRMTMGRSKSVKDAAAEIMESAYMKASGNGTLPANARQIMYAARGYIQEKTGKQLESNYFTQTLLPNYVLETASTGMSSMMRVDISPSRIPISASESAPWRSGTTFAATIIPLSLTPESAD